MSRTWVATGFVDGKVGEDGWSERAQLLALQARRDAPNGSDERSDHELTSGWHGSWRLEAGRGEGMRRDRRDAFGAEAELQQLSTCARCSVRADCEQLAG